MRRGSTATTALALMLGATGCHSLRGPDCAPAEGCAPGGEEIVVHAPQQRVVVRTPPCAPETCPSPPAPAAPQGVPPAAPQGVPPGLPQGVPPGLPQGVMGFPQGAFGAQPFGVQPMAAAPFGTGGVSNATVTTKQKTRFALTTSTINIAIPCLKLTPFTEAPETTIKISGTQTAQAQGFGGVPMGVMPAGFAGGSLTGVQGSFVQGQVVGPPVAQGVIGTQTVAPGVAAQGVAAPQGAQAQGVTTVCVPVDPNGITPERLQALRKKIEELEAAKKAQDEGKAKDEGKTKDPAPAPKEK